MKELLADLGKQYKHDEYKERKAKRIREADENRKVIPLKEK